MPLLSESKHCGGVKAIEHDDGHAGQRCHGSVGDQASDVEERRYAYHDVIFAKLHPLPVDGRIKNDISMGVHSTFRQSCRARCVGEKGDICWCKAGKLKRCSIKFGEQLEHLKRLREAQLLRRCQESGKLSLTSIVEFARGDNELHLRASNRIASNRFVQRLKANQPFCSRVIEVVLKLLLLEHRVAEHHDSPYFPYRIHGDQKLGDVLQVQRYPITVRNTTLLERSSQSSTLAVKFTVSHRFIEVVRCGLIGHSLHCRKKHLESVREARCHVWLYEIGIVLEPGASLVGRSGVRCLESRIVYHHNLLF